MEIGMGETKKMQKRSKWQQTKLEMKKYRMSYVMIAPYFILFFLFTVLPVLASIGISFTDFNMLETPNFVGWRNYIKLLLDDDVFKKSIQKHDHLCSDHRPVKLHHVFPVCVDHQ